MFVTRGRVHVMGADARAVAIPLGGRRYGMAAWVSSG